MSTQNVGNANVSLGHEGQVFVTTETAYGTAVAASAAEAVRFKSLARPYTRTQNPVEEKSAHRGVEAMIEGPNSGEFTLETYLRPSGTAGVVPRLDALLQTIFPDVNSPSADTIESSPTPAIGQYDMGDASDLLADDMQLVPLSAGGRVVRIVTQSDPTITVSPPLPTAPAGTETPAASKIYRLETRPTASVTIGFKGTNYGEWFTGAVANALTISGGGGSEPMLSMSGFYAKHAFAHYDVLDAAIVAVDSTSMTVTNPYRFRASTTAPAWVQIDDEAIKITAINYTTGVCTIVRAQDGTSGATHLDEAAITPYFPTASLSTTQPMHGLVGKARYALDSAGVDLYITNWEVAITNQAKLLTEVYGERYPIGYVTGEKREVTVTLGAYLTKSQGDEYGRAHELVNMSDLLIQVGDTAGDCIALCMPQVRFNTPNIPDDTAEETIIPLEGRALSDSTGNDELILGWF